MNFTDYLSFHPSVQKFRVAIKCPNKVFLSIGEGGKGSEYMFLTPPEAETLAHYLIVEAYAAREYAEGKEQKKKA